MEFVYSFHWSKKRQKPSRKNISDYLLEYAIQNSNVIKDRKHTNASNAICRIPPSGRMLKVVYRRIENNKIKIITAYWVD